MILALIAFIVVAWCAVGFAIAWVRSSRALRAMRRECDMLEDVVRDHPGRRTPGHPVNLDAPPARVTKGRMRQERRYWNN